MLYKIELSQINFWKFPLNTPKQNLLSGCFFLPNLTTSVNVPFVVFAKDTSATEEWKWHSSSTGQVRIMLNILKIQLFS